MEFRDFLLQWVQALLNYLRRAKANQQKVHRPYICSRPLSNNKSLLIGEQWGTPAWMAHLRVVACRSLSNRSDIAYISHVLRIGTPIHASREMRRFWKVDMSFSIWCLAFNWGEYFETTKHVKVMSHDQCMFFRHLDIPTAAIGPG